MRRFRILVADHDPAIRRLIRTTLEHFNYQTLMAMDGTETVKIIEKEILDLIILDTGLSGMSGLEILQFLREWSQVPVIMLSDQRNEEYKINCLNSGADEFLYKPFRIEELAAHIKNIFRRADPLSSMSEQSSYSCGNLEISFRERKVKVANHEIRLTPTEYNLLQELALNAEKVLTHTLLLNKVWGPEYSQEREYLRVFVGRLRKKLEPDPHKPNYIVTIPWVGYKLSSTTSAVLTREEQITSRMS